MSLSLKRILVTGGCGFIGANFVRLELETDPEISITNLDALTYAGNPDNLADLAGHPRYRFVRGDIADRGLRARAAGRGAVRRDRQLRGREPRRPLDRRRHAVPPDQRPGHPVPARRGPGGAGPPATSRSPPTRSTARSRRTTRAFPETTPLAPNSPYAASKAGADLLVRAAHHTHGMETVITRCSNNYGPYQFPEKLIPLFITNALADIPLPVYGDGLQVRDWIHVPRPLPGRRRRPAPRAGRARSTTSAAGASGSTST